MLYQRWYSTETKESTSQNQLGSSPFLAYGTLHHELVRVVRQAACAVNGNLVWIESLLCRVVLQSHKKVGFSGVFEGQVVI